jgi:uncharacterized membrane protein
VIVIVVMVVIVIVMMVLVVEHRRRISRQREPRPACGHALDRWNVRDVPEDDSARRAARPRRIETHL